MEFMGFLRTVVQKHAFNVVQTKAYIHGARLLRTRLAAQQSEDCLYLNIRTISPRVLSRANSRSPLAGSSGSGRATETAGNDDENINESPSEGEGETDSSGANSSDDDGMLVDASAKSGAAGAAEGVAEARTGARATAGNTPLPVIVYFHGGDYHDGAGGSRPFYAANALPVKGRVVLVTFNYRLGLLGHFTHPELSKEAEEEGRGRVSGNYSIQDQVRAYASSIASFVSRPSSKTFTP